MLMLIIYNIFLHFLSLFSSTPSIGNSCLYVVNNRLSGLARYLQAVFIESKFLEDLIDLKLET